MKIIIHNGEKLQKILSLDGQSIILATKSCTTALWLLAERFPDELICWCDENLVRHVDFKGWSKIFHHDLIMTSYAVNTPFFSETIGYIDLLPFAHVNREVVYGTWRMSSDVGGIKGRILLKFKDAFQKVRGFCFSFVLNSIAKVGQQNGLFCYSNPDLLSGEGKPEQMSTPKASQKDLFRFVRMHYSLVWVHILLWCFFRYEKALPLLPYLSVLITKNVHKQGIDFSEISVESSNSQSTSNSVDVILPTMGRPSHAFNVLEDLKKQSLPPNKVIVIEQSPDPESTSNLKDIKSQVWPFEIVHLFIRQTGACNARNLGLRQVTSDYVFFCDDDNRLKSDLLKKALAEMKRLGCDILNTAYRQPGERIIFDKIKQWGTFGAGNSILRRECLNDVWFSPIFEYGYGEDQDFGMQLRKKGWDIIYHPGLEIIHLKAPMGGFRERIVMPWEERKPLPKPSPTVMALAKKYYTKEQIRGFKISLFLKFYRKQKVLNPFSYLKVMERQWQKSDDWASFLIKTNGNLEKARIPVKNKLC